MDYPEPVTPLDPEHKLPAPQAYKKRWVVLIGLAVLLAVATVGYLILNNKNSNNYTPVPLTTIPNSTTPTTDAQLDADSASLDQALQSVDSEITTVDQGLSDKQGDLAE
jgi:flagellar basal body-associated protein FliL